MGLVYFPSSLNALFIKVLVMVSPLMLAHPAFQSIVRTVQQYYTAVLYSIIVPYIGIMELAPKHHLKPSLLFTL